MAHGWGALPAELRGADQWCIAAPDKSPYRLDGSRASVTDATHWTDFYSASETAAAWGAGAGIGYVLAEGSGVTCIDLDVKDYTTPEELARYEKIIASFDSYTERSKSGRGYHIWVKGEIGAGCRRGGVEVYSRERFIICTGNVVKAAPMRDAKGMLDLLVSEMRGADADRDEVGLVEIAETETDAVVYQKALGAANGAKFSELWAGRWRGMPEYPSQSEADLSLLAMLAFYSASNAQVRRLFRYSELGKREKAAKNDRYLNASLKLIRARQSRDAAAQAHGEAVAVQLVSRMEAEADVHKKLFPAAAPDCLPWPPGPVGELAKWMFSIAPRPVKEVSIISALGVFAGILGRAYNISNSGLNLYLVLVARSAIGKESIHSGISKFMSYVGPTCATVTRSLDFAEYASGPALIKGFDGRSSFCNIAGEWGRKLRKMADDHAEGPMSSLRTVMTNIYQKSSAGTIVGGIGYSDKEKDVKSIDGVAYSMIGETTPDTFYESLTNTMMQDGFMSRFIVIEYTGPRPALNKNMDEPLSHDLVRLLTEINASIEYPKMPGAFCNVGLSDVAQKMLDDFNAQCDEQINGTNEEAWRQMWNRAHLKALKVSGLLAAARDYRAPVVNEEEATWALNLIKADIKVMSRKMADGDVGDGDHVREKKLISIIAHYLKYAVPPGYRVPESMRQSGVINRRYMQAKTASVNSFAKSRIGQSAELDRTIKSLSDSGYIVEVPRDKIPVDWGSPGRCFRVLYLPDIV